MRRYSLGFLGLLLLAAACETPLDNRKLLDDFVVATSYDEATNFANFETFAIPTDTIGFASNVAGDTILVSPTSPFPRAVINAIKAKMVSRGYQQVDRTADPNLGINITVVNNFDLVQQVVYPSNYYSGYYGYSSYYYSPYVNTYTSNTGVLIIEIVDLENRAPGNKVKVVWKSIMGDVYSAYDVVSQATDAIEQSFEQSQYIKN